MVLLVAWCMQLTVVIEPLDPGLEAAGLVDGAGHHGLAAHDVLAHGELGQVVGGGARLERDVSGVRQLELHWSLARAAHSITGSVRWCSTGCLLAATLSYSSFSIVSGRSGGIT